MIRVAGWWHKWSKMKQIKLDSGLVHLNFCLTAVHGGGWKHTHRVACRELPDWSSFKAVGTSASLSSHKHSLGCGYAPVLLMWQQSHRCTAPLSYPHWARICQLIFKVHTPITIPRPIPITVPHPTFTVGLDPKDLFQTRWFYDSIIYTKWVKQTET